MRAGLLIVGGIYDVLAVMSQVIIGYLNSRKQQAHGPGLQISGAQRSADEALRRRSVVEDHVEQLFAIWGKRVAGGKTFCRDLPFAICIMQPQLALLGSRRGDEKLSFGIDGYALLLGGTKGNLLGLAA